MIRKQSLSIALRDGAVTMTAVLGAWVSALAIARVDDLGDEVVVLAVALTLMSARAVQRQAVRWSVRAVVLPVAALAAGLAGRLIVDHPSIGDAVFVVAVSTSVWLRRFGPTWSAVGTLLALPFVSLLAVPVVVAPGDGLIIWPALISLVALAWVLATRAVAIRTGWLPAPTGPAPSHPVRTATRRLLPSTRMALQLAVALTVAFALGRTLYPDHWSWCVLSCYVVCSGNRGRGDVAHKGLSRVGGALGGTLVATLVAEQIAPGDPMAIVLLFVVMAFAVVLRPLGYGYWAAGVTAMLALLYGFYGQSGSELLDERLGGVLLGSLAAVAASWWVLPVRSGDVFRRRWADALAAVSEHLASLRAHTTDAAAVDSSARALDEALGRLEELEPTYRLHRRASVRRRPHAHPAELVGALRELRRALADVAAAPVDDDTLVDWSRRVGVVRRRMRTAGSVPSAPPATDTGDQAIERVDRAIATLDVMFADEVWRRLGGRAEQPGVSDRPHVPAVTNR